MSNQGKEMNDADSYTARVIDEAKKVFMNQSENLPVSLATKLKINDLRLIWHEMVEPALTRARQLDRSYLHAEGGSE